MRISPICVDAGLVVWLVAMPEQARNQQLWDAWTEKSR
jgi:hypothetical protein